MFGFGKNILKEKIAEQRHEILVRTSIISKLQKDNDTLEGKLKSLNIHSVNGHVPVELSDFLHRLRLAEHPEIKKQSIDLFNRYCR